MLKLERMEKYCPRCFKEYSNDLERCPEDDTRLVATLEENLIGKVLDERYEILSKLGQGGMGVVYVAEQAMIGRRVALKVLRMEMVRDKSAVQRFLVEAKAIASLNSPHTITLHDFGVTREGLLYYTMELLEGDPLSKIIRREGAMEYRGASELILQALDSLEEAHEHGILHRDLKPDNLFVSQRRGKAHVSVLDFGIAKLVGDTSIETITKTGMICGTPAYLSPEQVMGRDVVPASDLYSLAIVFYEMLAGKPPFQKTTGMELLLSHLNETPGLMSVRNPDVAVPISIERLIQCALAKKPDERLASTAQFREALTGALEQAEKEDETVALPPMGTGADGARTIVGEQATLGASASVDAPAPEATPVPKATTAPAATTPYAPPAVAVDGTAAISPLALGQAPVQASARAADTAEVMPPTARTLAEGTPGQALAATTPIPTSPGTVETVGSPSAWKWIALSSLAIAAVVVALVLWQPWKGQIESSEPENKNTSGTETARVETTMDRPVSTPDVVSGIVAKESLAPPPVADVAVEVVKQAAAPVAEARLADIVEISPATGAADGAGGNPDGLAPPTEPGGNHGPGSMSDELPANKETGKAKSKDIEKKAEKKKAEKKKAEKKKAEKKEEPGDKKSGKLKFRDFGGSDSGAANGKKVEKEKSGLKFRPVDESN